MKSKIFKDLLNSPGLFHLTSFVDQKMEQSEELCIFQCILVTMQQLHYVTTFQSPRCFCSCFMSCLKEAAADASSTLTKQIPFSQIIHSSNLFVVVVFFKDMVIGAK